MWQVDITSTILPDIPTADKHHRLYICLCYDSYMKSLRRLLLMACGLVILSSASFSWFGFLQPGYATLGQIISDTLANLFGNAITINIAWLNTINCAQVIFSLGVLTIMAAVLSSKPLSLISFALSLLFVVIWAISIQYNLLSIIPSFLSLGIGLQMMLLANLAALAITIAPKLSKFIPKPKPSSS